MNAVSVDSRVREASITAVITRADGSVENLGMISYYHVSPLKRLAWRIKQILHWT